MKISEAISKIKKAKTAKVWCMPSHDNGYYFKVSRITMHIYFINSEKLNPNLEIEMEYDEEKKIAYIG